jgi:carboxyl-terminal processing protease
MPRRNLLILLVVMLVALVCYQRVERNPYVRVLANALDTVEKRSLEPVKNSKLFEGAMEGMLGDLDDYSTYIPPADLPKFQETIDLQFAGVGMELVIDPETKQLKVLSPLVGTPAYRAGILAGDRILRIGKTATEGMSLAEAGALLRGKPGEAITLAIVHEGKEKPEEVKLVREIVQVPSVLGDTRNADGSWNFMLEGRDRIGYTRVSSFTDDTVIELNEVLAGLAARGLRGLVLDLRDDPGGYLDAAVDVCDLWVRSGVIVTTRRRGGQISRTCTASGNAPFAALPMAVVVNQQTASAAEIVAACLQDHDRAVIVGQRTFGKGTVQEIIELGPDCGAMKLTTSSYWRPSGVNIQRPPHATAKDRWGVSPNEGYQVVLDKDEFDRWQHWRAERDVFQSAAARAHEPSGKPFVDRQLRRAVEYLEKPTEGRMTKSK